MFHKAHLENTLHCTEVRYEGPRVAKATFSSSHRDFEVELALSPPIQILNLSCYSSALTKILTQWPELEL